MLSRRTLVLAAATLAVLDRAGAQAAPLPVVASFSILGDFVRQVGGDSVALTTIVGPDGDAHVYEPSPSDARKLAKARLVFVNGLGFEGWFDRLIKAANSKAAVVTASRSATPRNLDDGLDPHAWQNAANAQIYVANIRDALKAADPDRAAQYDARAGAYIEKLAALDAEIKNTIDALPKERRRVVSTHDAFGYFSARYGIEFIAPQGVSTDAEASARDIARIIDAIKRHKIAAVFLENVADQRLTRRIAAETGAKIGGELYSDALSSANGPAATYIDMMRHNVRELVKALAS